VYSSSYGLLPDRYMILLIVKKTILQMVLI